MMPPYSSVFPEIHVFYLPGLDLSLVENHFLHCRKEYEKLRPIFSAALKLAHMDSVAAETRLSETWVICIARHGNVDEVLRFHEAMQQNNMRLSSWAAVEFAEALVSHGKPEEALILLQQDGELGVHAAAIKATALMHVGRLEEAVEAITTCPRFGHSVLDHTAITVFTVAKSTENLHIVHQQLQKRHFKDEVLLHRLLLAYQLLGEMDCVRSLCTAVEHLKTSVNSSVRYL